MTSFDIPDPKCIHIADPGNSQPLLADFLGDHGWVSVAEPDQAGVRLICSEEAESIASQVAASRRRFAHLPVVVMAPVHDPAEVRDLLKGGAADLVLPAEKDRLLDALTEAVGREQLFREKDWLLNKLAAGYGENTQRLQTALEQLQESADDVLRVLILALDAREQETAGHSYRVALWTLYFARHCGVDEGAWADTYRGALLHDIGKLAIPDHILLKRGKLTTEEWETMRSHPRRGYELLSSVRVLRGAGEIAYAHHEHWDGTGYPRGLKGDAIPLGARLFTLVDVYDALRSRRPYKEPMDHASALRFLEKSRESHFDPRLTDRFLEVPESQWDLLAADQVQAKTYDEVLASLGTR